MPQLKADRLLLSPRIIVGKHPVTGVIYRLTITTKKELRIERPDYVSDHPDGWRQTYPTLTEDAEKHIWLILTISQHPAEWPLP